MPAWLIAILEPVVKDHFKKEYLPRLDEIFGDLF